MQLIGNGVSLFVQAESKLKHLEISVSTQRITFLSVRKRYGYAARVLLLIAFCLLPSTYRLLPSAV